MRGMEELDTLEVQALLEDYATSDRREHCSRQDFAAGWRAAKLRFEQEQQERSKRGRLRIAV